MKRLPRTSCIGAVLLCTAALAGCSQQSTDVGKEAATPRTVKFVTIDSRAIESGIAASGQLAAREEAAVAPQLSGYQVERVMVDQGDWVTAGQPLAVLDDTLLRSEIAQQQAAVTQARVSAEQAQAQSQRVASLDDSGVLSAEAIQERRLGARTAQAQLAQAQAMLTDKRVRERLMIIRAPVAGRILERTARPGDVSSPQTTLFRIARNGQVELNAEIPEQSITLIRLDQAAQVTLADGAEVTGRVRLIASEIDAQTRLGRVRITLPAQSNIRAGGFAKAILQADSAKVTAVPEAAIRFGADGATVTTIGQGNRVREVSVKVGRRGGGFAELIKGPAAGTRVLLRGQSFVLEGDQVKPVAASAQELR
ncbi:efflux RND transporter periplasmic adaptor subunit [Sphingomonas radiodurans]|uniref:efflux RND transporter periplasmic adaptor subunit n=1 Tax=Sphingomonas radiodurans TaxID=2890321 RepID=UPI001E5C5965|nr:efflux RND transporter periplasmic adaptor subunit [Sphingomonas radiodurans]WBH15828.1 efflux RND transporter periplasmic adaptor subunit [Sphingomonas radiodurans]